MAPKITTQGERRRQPQVERGGEDDRGNRRRRTHRQHEQVAAQRDEGHPDRSDADGGDRIEDGVHVRRREEVVDRRPPPQQEQNGDELDGVGLQPVGSQEALQQGT